MVTTKKHDDMINKNNGDDTMKLNEEDAIIIISYRWKNWARCDVIKKETKNKKRL